MALIIRELDELEREDFTRIKKVQANKAVAAKIEKDRAVKQAADEATHIATTSAEPASTSVPASVSASAKSKKAKKADKAVEEKPAEPVLSGFDAADDEDVVFK
jgi:hypothetical protein